MYTAVTGSWDFPFLFFCFCSLGLIFIAEKPIRMVSLTNTDQWPTISLVCTSCIPDFCFSTKITASTQSFFKCG